MAVSVLSRPQGHTLDSTGVGIQFFAAGSSVIMEDSMGSSHGLSTGDYVYIFSDVNNYNGFWYVEVVSATAFYIRQYATSSRVDFITTFTATGVYHKVLTTHGFSCLHLPIIYKLTNTAWPTNSIDTARTETGTVDDNGYCKVTVSGAIKASGIAENLDYIEVQTGTLAGIYQIINLYSNTVFTLNIPYSAANDAALSGGTLQYYYSNYTVRIKVWAGINSWASLKPMTALAEIDIKPDASNNVSVNIAEILKEKVKVISNNLQLATLPNDIDSFTEFFIEYTETYDKSDYGDVMTTYIAPYTNDQSNFQGVAVNSKLQFKNRYSGYLSEYLATNSSAKFLTLFDEPRYFIGCYYDISFLLVSGGYKIKLETYKNSVLQSTSTTSLTNTGPGLYRYPIALFSGALEDRIDVTLIDTNVLASLSSWANGSTGTDWAIISTPTVILNGINAISKYLYTSFVPLNGIDYNFSYNIDVTDASTVVLYLRIYFLDASFNIKDTYEVTGVAGTANYTGTATLTGTSDTVYIGIRFALDDAGGANATAQVNSFGYTSKIFSETKTINVDSECSFQDIYLTWKNYLGGMDYWKFTAQKDYITDIEGTTETTENIFPEWPNSYGEFADTIDKETSRTSRDKIVVRSQNMTESEMNAVRYIVSSPLVQVMVSKNDRRTVKVSTGSFTWKRDEDKLYSIEFEISYTNTIPSQSL